MASFDHTSSDWKNVDFQFLQNGPISLFWKPELFAEAVGDLFEYGYQVCEMDARHWSTESDLCDTFAESLDFPDYFGRNLDALNDCLSDVAHYSYGSSVAATGTLVAIDNWDMLQGRDGQLAFSLLNILADCSRCALLFGHRFVVLIRSNDPHIETERVGATPILWNRREQFNYQRNP